MQNNLFDLNKSVMALKVSELYDSLDGSELLWCLIITTLLIQVNRPDDKVTAKGRV